MPNYNGLTYTAAEYKILLLLNGIPYPLVTVNDFSSNVKAEDETGYAIGEEDPIIEKTNALQYSGKLSMRIGELNAILLANGLKSAASIRNATLGITSIDGLFHRVYSGVNILSEDIDIKAKDKDTIVPLSWKAVSIV